MSQIGQGTETTFLVEFDIINIKLATATGMLNAVTSLPVSVCSGCQQNQVFIPDCSSLV